jgi:hypothetical protein
VAKSSLTMMFPSTATVKPYIPKVFFSHESELLSEKACELLICGCKEDLSLSAHRQITQMVKKNYSPTDSTSIAPVISDSPHIRCRIYRLQKRLP